MKDLANKGILYHSVFQQPFFHYLQKLHNQYGARFTLYVYTEADDYKIEDLPTRFKKELTNNSYWLKSGFHAIRPTFSKSETSKLDSFRTAFLRVKNGISRFAGDKSRSQCLRLHYFYATTDERLFWANNNIKILLTADDPKRISYSLPQNKHTLTDTPMKYLATDMRIENQSISPLWDLYRHDEHDTFVVFTHG